MRVLADQRNPPPRRKGVRKKRVRKQKGKINMKKLKSLFGGDLVVKLLLSLVDKQSRGPNMKSQARKELGEGKVRKMKKAKGGGSFQTPAQVKADRAKREKEERIKKASIVKPGETSEDVLNRLIKEVAVGGDPASLAFLKANTIPPELRKLVGKMSVFGEAYFDENITPAKKKSIERAIIKEIIEGIGGDVRKDFIKTSKEDDDVIDGFKEGIEALKKAGYTDAEKIIQNKDDIEKKLKKKKEKSKTGEEEEEIDKAIEGLQVVNEIKTTDADELEDLPEKQIEEIKKKVGKKKQTDTQRKNILLSFAQDINTSLLEAGDNREFFIKFIEDGIDSGAKNADIKSKMRTQLKKLAKGEELQSFKGKKESTNVIRPPTRADADIFAKGAVVNKPDQFKIDLPDGTSRIYDGEKLNPNIKYLNKQIRLFLENKPSDIGTQKELKAKKRQLAEERKLFRNQLVSISEGEEFVIEQGYNRKQITLKDQENETKLGEILKKEGYFIPKGGIQLGKDEVIVGVGEEGYALKSKDGFIRYFDVDLKAYKKQQEAQKKADAVEKKRLRQLGIDTTEQTEIQQLIEDLPFKEDYNLGLLTDEQENSLPPRLKDDYKKRLQIAIKDRQEQLKIESGGDTGEFKTTTLDKDFEEGNVFDRTTGRAITEQERIENPFAAFDALGEGGEDILTQEEAEEKREEQVVGTGKFLEDYTEEELQQLREGPELTDAFGKPIDPIASIPRRPKTEEEEAQRKKEKQEKQEELIERYKVDKSVLKDIKLPGRKKLAQQGLYELNTEELKTMSKKERKKYELILANRKAIVESAYGEGGKEEADRLILLRNQGKELTDEELSKISYQDRLLQGLLTEKEVKAIKDKTAKKDYLDRKKRIDEQIEAVKLRERKEIIGDTIVEGDDFDRLKEQADYYGETRKEVKEREDKDTEIEKGLEELEEALPPPNFGFLPRTPERRPRIEETIVDKPETPKTPERPKRPKKKGAGIDNSISEQDKQQNSLEDVAPKKKRGRPKKKPVKTGQELLGEIDKKKEEEEKKRKAEEMDKKQQKELAELVEKQTREQSRQLTDDELIARNTFQNLLRTGGTTGSEEEFDFKDDEGGEEDYLLEDDF